MSRIGIVYPRANLDTVPSLVGSLTQISRQTTANACATMAPRVEAMRPGLRAQMPVPSADLRGGPRRPPAQAQNPPRRTAQ